MAEVELDELLRALSHAQRRLFVSACLPRECSAGELAELSQLALASVSEHLKVLRKCGLLQLEVRGRFWFYRTDRAVLRAAAAALAAIEEASDGS
ncbi:MAG: winged helix-turn-helix transcriptional regulator [Burkholderiaceae bacterium]|nr:winged helix-turn-helix transcriptional regulator [Burkholderiaceae bacterium]